MVLTFRETEKLSDIPSEFLLEALGEFEKVEQTPGFTVEMGWWLTPASESLSGTCEVCLAGAVIAARCGIEEGRTAYDFEEGIANKLLAIDAFRKGFIREALRSILGINPSTYDLPYSIEVPHYHADRELWWEKMRELVVLLKEAGL